MLYREATGLESGAMSMLTLTATPQAASFDTNEFRTSGSPAENHAGDSVASLRPASGGPLLDCFTLTYASR
jgi:hypothetical protein